MNIMKPPNEKKFDKNHHNKDHMQKSPTNFIKASLSMTSLQPPRTVNENSEYGPAKLRFERPYNSLKKKRDSERELWRRSWESGHSHSSCSLQSSNTNNTGSGIGKDDFWAALQNNYNFIMDTNLLDSCREARGELEGTVVPEFKALNCCKKSVCQSSQSQGSFGDPRRLRRWLREMENRLSKTPTLSEAIKLKSGELQKRLAEHSELYREIVSQSRIVAACIRASETENNISEKQQSKRQQQKQLHKYQVQQQKQQQIQQEQQNQDEQQSQSSQQPPPPPSSPSPSPSSSVRATDFETSSVHEEQSDKVQDDEQDGEKVHDKTISSLTSSERRGDGVGKGLERRYHLLYLKAIEVQCFFENILERKKSPTPPSSRSSIDTDEEPAAKLARLSDCEDTAKVYNVDKKSDNKWNNLREKHILKDSIGLAGFDADSEGSDGEIGVRNQSNNSSLLMNSTLPQTSTSPSAATSSSILVSSNCIAKTTTDYINQQQNHSANSNSTKKLLANENMMHTDIYNNNNSNNVNNNSLNKNCYIKDNNGNLELSVLTTTSTTTSPSNHNNITISSEKDELNIITTITPPSQRASASSNSLSLSSCWTNNASNNKNINNESFNSNTANTVIKRPKKIDISKFNRSNRKSKNCAIFYFKHLDTDNEQNKEFSESDAVKSTEQSSEDDEWYYTNHHEDEAGEELNNDALADSTSEKANNCGRRLEFDDIPSYDIVDGNNMYYSMCENKTELNNKNMAISNIRKESIKKLVLDAESLVREDVLIKKPKTIMAPLTNGQKNAEKLESNKTKIIRIHEWLEHQPNTAADIVPSLSVPTTDCEASGEYTTDSDSVNRDTDTSEGVTDSVATCLQGEYTSQCTSIEKLGGSNDLLSSNDGQTSNVTPVQQSKVIMRMKRRNSERPWSVSCISQLTQNSNHNPAESATSQQGLSNFSISESALHKISFPGSGESGPVPNSSFRNADSKGSLRKRKMRTRKKAGLRKNDSGSDDVYFEQPRVGGSKTLTKSESFSGQTTIMNDLNLAMSVLTIPELNIQPLKLTSSEMESEEEVMKPNFKIGCATNVYGNAINLGSLAALANYNNDDDRSDYQINGTVPTLATTEEMSSSEQAWDSYQEKYNSEPYSEDRDTDAARRLLEFGDDYRNFLDSQSDCCSSLGAANFDSLSPPRMRRVLNYPPTKSSRSPSEAADSSLEMKRKRSLELPEQERRRRNSNRVSDERRKSINCENIDDKKLFNSSHGSDKSHRKYSESDNSTNSRRRSIRSNDKQPLYSRSNSNNKTSSPSGVASGSRASCSSDSSSDIDVKLCIKNSRNRWEHTEALKIRSHLLRPEDYKEIIATCRENLHCLATVLRSPPNGTPLSAKRCIELQALHASWESLLHWNENAAVARQLQEEISQLKSSINRLGLRSFTFDSEESIQNGIEKLKNDRIQLQNQRSNMLRVNANVHSWLTRQEIKKAKYLEQQQEQQLALKENGASSDKGAQFDVQFVDEELHKQLKDDVGDMYSTWDEADERIRGGLENLTTSIATWKQFDSGITEFQETLGKDRGALYGLKGALETGKTTSNDLIYDVKEVAKLLSERTESNIKQTPNPLNENSNAIINNAPTNMTQFCLTKSSNGSLSDSGISDGGGISDASLSEREKRLGALRRLAKQLENALTPDSKVLKTITQRMETAEAELRALQNTCRDLIIKTAEAQKLFQQQQQDATNTGAVSTVNSYQHNQTQGNSPINVQIPIITIKGKMKRSPQSKRKNKRRSPNSTMLMEKSLSNSKVQNLPIKLATASEPDPDDPKDDSEVIDDEEDDKKIEKRNGWIWRVARMAVPIQLAIITLFLAACFLEPHCCDNLNTMTRSFTPQLRYIRGPPPV